MKKLNINTLSLALALAILPGAVLAQALPENGSFRIGNGTITAPNGVTLNVGVDGSNGSNLALIDWDSFNVGQGNTVNFNNNTGRPLGVINVDMNGDVFTGIGNPSNINGNINAPSVGGNNTTVLVLNPQGVNVGGSAVINTSGAFIAGAGSVDTSPYPNVFPPAGKVAVRLTSRFVKIEDSAQINTGDAQGVGDGLAFMGTGGLGYHCGATGCNPTYPGDGTGGASLPFISGNFVGDFYTADPSMARDGMFGSTFFLNGFDLDNSGAVYQFNGPYAFGLLIAKNFDIDPNTGEEGNRYFLGGQLIEDVLFGTVDLGNATFTTKPGDGGGLYVRASSVIGGRFIVPDAMPAPIADFARGNFLTFNSAGNIDGTEFVANGVGRVPEANETASSAEIRATGNISNASFTFGPGTLFPSVGANGTISNSTIKMDVTSRSNGNRGTVAGLRGITNSNFEINTTAGTWANVSTGGTGAGIVDTTITNNGSDGDFNVSSNAGISNSTVYSASRGRLDANGGNRIENSSFEGGGDVSVFASRPNSTISDATVRSNGENAYVSLMSGGNITRAVVQSGGSVSVNAQGAISELLARGNEITVFARLDLNGDIQGDLVSIFSIDGNIVNSTVAGRDVSVRARGIDGSSLTGSENLFVGASSETGLSVRNSSLSGASVSVSSDGSGDASIENSEIEAADVFLSGDNVSVSRTTINADRASVGSAGSTSITDSQVEASETFNVNGGNAAISGSTISANRVSIGSTGQTSITGGRVEAVDTLNVSGAGVLLTGGAQLEGANVSLQSTGGDLDIGGSEGGAEVRGDQITGSATGTVFVRQGSAVRVRDPQASSGNNNIWVGNGTIGQTANVQASGFNWFGGTVSVVDGAYVLNAPTTVDAPAGTTGISLTGGDVKIDGTLFAGEGTPVIVPPEDPTIPSIPVVIRVFQDGDQIRWSGTRLDIKTDHEEADGGLNK